ncbi:MAG TPA: hypothetical protein VIV88_09425 [Gemmatimonadales bacterium]
MRELCLRILIVIALGAPAQAADAQRLAPGFPSADASPFLTTAAFSSAGGRLRYQPRDCRFHPVLLAAAGGLGGAAGGWLAYELTIGIWASGETGNAAPDATFRRIRGTLIVTGAIIGVVRAVHISKQCRSG